jgi:glucosylceramidase
MNPSLAWLTAATTLLAGAARAAEPPQVAASPQPVTVYVSARDTGERLAARPPVAMQPLLQPDEHQPTVMVDPRKTFQTMEGIGGALTDAAAETFAKLPPERQRELLRAYFDPEQGIGYSLARTHIHSCDFSSESYSYDDVPGDTALAHFSIEHDRRYKLPFIEAAIRAAGGSLKLFASPWSPPAWMKTNGSMLEGGELKPEDRDAWARYIVRFVQAYEKEGVPIWGLTVQNEPMAKQTWESCLYTAEQERDFVRDHLGPALVQAGLWNVKLMIWDHNRGLLYQRAKVVYDDPAASRYVWGTAFHWYTGDHWDNVRITHDAWPQKALLFSESTAANFDKDALGEWKWGEMYAESMIRDFNDWAVGWTDWNVLLDEHGGPNHVGNFCLAAVHGDTRTGQLTYLSSYYAIGHFSKFVRPGARRIACTSNDDRLLATAFRNADGRIAVVVLNKGDEAVPFELWRDGQAAKLPCPAHSFVTALM